MKLSDLLPKLVKNDEKTIKLVDKNNNRIVTFNPTGFEAINADLNNRDVLEIIFVDAQHIIKITVDDAVTVPLNPDQMSGSNITP